MPACKLLIYFYLVLIGQLKEKKFCIISYGIALL